ncbi:hypothetical protein FPQ18DRAFT_307604 [Pyronema domesticum]|nr:hypothetical protein FPQ18DRAFT_307604 [Pyronema domesticum]
MTHTIRSFLRMTSGSSRWIIRRSTTTAPETTTPGPRIIDLTDDYEARTPGGTCPEIAIMDRGNWETYVGLHVEDVIQPLGNGPTALDSYPSSSNYQFRPPAGFAINK